MIGHIPGVKIGSKFVNRRALHDAGVHRGLMQGIGAKGESIVLSGGYVDDVDKGDVIVYTGQGGRSRDSGRQVKDQELTRGNAALARHHREGNPIRVSRGGDLDSPYAPNYGYRYDGLYRIDEVWEVKGRDGFKVYRFRLVRLEGQPPIGELEHD